VPDEFRAGARAFFDHLLSRAANNWHPAAMEACEKENALIHEWAEDALASVSPEDHETWRSIVELQAEVHRLNQQLAAAPQHVAEVQPSGWIACSERMPEVKLAFSEPVWTFNGKVQQARWYSPDKEWRIGDMFQTIEGVTHWTAIFVPEPPSTTGDPS
jgi:hypothetical protein